MHFVNFMFIWLVANNSYNLITLPAYTPHNTSITILNFRDYCGLYTFFTYNGIYSAKLITFENTLENTPEIVTECVNVPGRVRCDINCSGILNEREHNLMLYNTGVNIGKVLGYRYTMFDIFLRAMRSIT